MNPNLSFEAATTHYLQAVGQGALIPNRSLSICKAGTWYLRNVKGALALVTHRGVVMDRIGGSRILGDQSDEVDYAKSV
jgi:hypothetical protein